MEDKIEVIFTQLPFEPNKGILLWIKHKQFAISHSYYYPIRVSHVYYSTDVRYPKLNTVAFIKEVLQQRFCQRGLFCSTNEDCMGVFETFLNASDVRIPSFQLPSHISLLQAGCYC
jgi:hypothetical protein